MNRTAGPAVAASVARVLRRVGPVVLAAALAGCELPAPPGHVDVPEGAVRSFDTGQLAEASGDSTRALAAYRDAIDHAPEFVDAHRSYQNLLLQRYRRGDLLREYEDFLAAAPGSAPRRYLLGRLRSHRPDQLDDFDRALWADPELFFGHIGVGYVSLEEGDVERALWSFRRAREIAPDRVEPLHGLLTAWSGRRRAGDGSRSPEEQEVVAELLRRDPVDEVARRAVVQIAIDAGAVVSACDEAVRFALEARTAGSAELAEVVLGRYGTSAILERARDRLAAPGILPESAATARLHAMLAERTGDPAAALHGILRVAPDLARDPEIVRTRRRLLLRTGDFARYLREVYAERHLTGLAIGDGGAADRRLGELVAAVSADGGRSDVAPARIVDELLAVGLHEAAIAFARGALDQDPADAAVSERLAAALRHRRFLSELAEYFEAQYLTPEPDDLETVIEALRDLSRDCLGENVIDPVVTRDFPPIGAFLDPDPASGGGFARYFDRYGCFALVGKRVGASGEAYVMRRIGTSRIDVDGRDVYRALGEDVLVRSRAEYLGAEIAGFAFQSFIALNADRVRDGAERARRLHRDLGPELLDDARGRAGSDEARRGLHEPLSVAVRAEYRAFARFLDEGGRPEEYAGLLLDAVEAHERAHILDAARFLPLYRDLGEKLRLLWEHRFQTSEVEAWLEERAQAVALVDARSPMAVLASTLLVLPDRDAAPPHSVGYYHLCARLVDEVASHPARYPEVDPGFSVVSQLDRLGDERLRELGRRVLATFD